MAYDSVRNDRSGGNASWVMHQMQSDPKGVWPTNYSNSENNNWNNAMVTGNREAVPYPGYPSNYWYPQSHTAGPYSNAYSSESVVNGHGAYSPQAMSGFPDAVYNPGPYPTGLLHPSNPFYCAEQPPPGQTPYPSQGCTEQRTGVSGQLPAQHCHYPISHCQGASGYPPAPYPQYGDGVHPVPQNCPYPSHTRPQPEAWSHAGSFGPATQQQWQPDAQPPHNRFGNPLLSPHPPVWTGSCVPRYEPQDPQYPGYPPQSQCMGPTQLPTNSGPVQTREISAPPQMYKTGKEQEVKPSPRHPPKPGPMGQPQGEDAGLARVQQVLARVSLLQKDVDEFVGHKTDKSYRCLEELLTKELLELDSVETNGQESVRQARKEAVQKIQGILDRLEKKAF